MAESVELTIAALESSSDSQIGQAADGCGDPTTFARTSREVTEPVPDRAVGNMSRHGQGWGGSTLSGRVERGRGPSRENIQQHCHWVVVHACSRSSIPVPTAHLTGWCAKMEDASQVASAEKRSQGRRTLTRAPGLKSVKKASRVEEGDTHGARSGAAASPSGRKRCSGPRPHRHRRWSGSAHPNQKCPRLTSRGLAPTHLQG
jgi:hypothetical protein